MKIIKISVILLILSTLLYANSNVYRQILISKTSKIKNLQLIKKRVNSLNIGIIIKKSNNKYFVYSKKIKSKKYAIYLLKKLKPYFPSAIILTYTKNTKKSKKIELKNKKTKNKNLNTITTKKIQNRYKDFFIATAFGMDSISGKTSNYLASKINNDDTTYAFESGYYFYENIFSSIKYLNSFTSDISLDSLYSSLNYEVTIIPKTKLYAGAILGLSLLRFEKPKDASDSKSILYGWQIGTNYSFYRYLDIFVSYEGLSINHSVDLSSSDEYIKLTYIHNLSLGIRYKF